MTRFPEMTPTQAATVKKELEKADIIAKGYRAKINAAQKVVKDVPRQVRARSETVQYLDKLIQKALTQGFEFTQEDMLKGMQTLRDQINEMDDILARLQETH